MRLELHISGNGLTERSRVLEGSLIEIGRDPDVAWSLPDLDATELVSAIHVRMIEAGGVCHVEDAGSTNGTFLNGDPLTQRTPLTIGDRLALGPGGPVITVLAIGAGEAAPAPTDRDGKAQQFPMRPVVLFVAAVVLIGVTVGREMNWFRDRSWTREAAPAARRPQGNPAETVETAVDDTQARLHTRDDSVTVEAGRTSVIDVLANDGDASARPRLVLTSVSESVLGAQIEISDDGQTLIYTATTTGTGIDRVTYNVADAEAPSRGTAVLNVEVRPGVADLTGSLQAVTWVGFRYIDEIHADECGWFVSSREVVTSARAAAGLKLLRDSVSDPSSVELIVAYGDEFLSVDRVTLHPGYEVSDPGARNSLACDVGLLHLSSSVSSVRPCVIETAVTAASEPGAELRAIGFVNETSLTDLHDPTRVRRVQTSVSVTGSVTGTISASPILTSSNSYARGMSGAPVFNAEGRVTGILSHFNERLVVVPARALLELTQ